jgi:hypothetical protein
MVGKRPSKRRWHGRIRRLGPRRAAFAGLVLGAALWNFASLCQLAGALLAGAAAGRGAAPAEGCTSLLLDRPTGRTRAWPCRQAPAWMETALRVD